MKRTHLTKMAKALAAFLLSCSFSLTTILAQEAIPASGGEASGDGGSASYSVGQIFYTTDLGENGSVAQGVQQPYEISVVITAIEDDFEMDLSIKAYPNPATDFLTLKIDASLVQAAYIASLFDINGKMLINKNIETNETSISIGSLVPGTYFLKVTDNGRELKVFKIVKR